MNSQSDGDRATILDREIAGPWEFQIQPAQVAA